MSKTFAEVLEKEHKREEDERQAKKKAIKVQQLMARYHEAKRFVTDVEAGKVDGVKVETKA